MEGGTVERAQALEMDTDTCLYLLEPPFSHLQKLEQYNLSYKSFLKITDNLYKSLSLMANPQ